MTVNRRMNPSTGSPGRFINAMEDTAYGRRAGRVFDDVSPASLPRGKRYTYVITEDGRMSFGMVEDSFEFGVKHMHIAGGRPVLVAGELEVAANGSLRFNLESGTFTRHILEGGGVTENVLAGRVQNILSREVGSSNVTRVGGSDILVPYSNTPPSAAELARLCASAEFLLNRGFCP
jgi:hypothetical protein